ncbi:pentapeptide repeat-containing protein [Bradyrhizobium sp. I1.7.5]|uniref:pentapeptide repeat-containing protein n=1 Tax=Bradyrhizobium sp. I1.7.5 TaxID=3156363 RepID=UPI003398D239
MPSTGRRRGLRKLSPDFIGKAADETAQQVTRIGLTFLGTTVFCLLSLLSPDSALLGGSEKINVPFAGSVSFLGFMLLGPAVLIVLRLYLQFYVEHRARLERLAQSMSIVRAPMLVPLQNPLIRYFSGLIFYLLLPLTMLLFTWKAAVFPAWGSGLLGVAAAVIASHLILPLKKFSWRDKAILSTGAAIVMFAMILGSGPVRRPFALKHANLSGQYLIGEDFTGADVSFANLNEANLTNANLSGANLSGASLRGTDLHRAHLSNANLFAANLRDADLLFANLNGAILAAADLAGAQLPYTHLRGATLTGASLAGAHLGLADLSNADLSKANLSNANLTRADLTGADLTGAKLSTAKNLTQEQLDKACGNASTQLPDGVTLKAMCKR